MATQQLLATVIAVVSFATTHCVAADNVPGPWIDLIPNINVQSNTVVGDWSKNADSLSTNAASGSRITLPFQPTTEYDFQVSFTRTSGVHSIALMFVCGSGQATFEIDAWGQHLAGLQMIDGRSVKQNSTRVENKTLENGRRYTMRVEIRNDQVRAYLDDVLLADHKTIGIDFGVPSVWRMPDSHSLGIGAYSSATVFHKIEVRQASDLVLASSNSVAATPAARSSAARSLAVRSPTARSLRPAADMRATQRRPFGSSGKRVLLVIANQDFFYREYNDPRQELERAGITVDVAAGRRQECRPHANSGQQGSGAVMPDLAITEVDVARYDAIMFSGGWGSSMYQYAFTGSYAKRVYNGDRQTKEAVNRLLNEFVRQDKYVGALCHGVSVLAWSRVNGKSILAGKRAVGSPRQSPAGNYNGQHDQPLSRWNAEVNGAQLSPARSIGDPKTSADDVVVDGKIVTGEDDNSAILFGKILARLVVEN